MWQTAILTKSNKYANISNMMQQQTSLCATNPKGVIYVTNNPFAELFAALQPANKRPATPYTRKPSTKRLSQQVPDLKDNEFWDKGESL